MHTPSLPNRYSCPLSTFFCTDGGFAFIVLVKFADVNRCAISAVRGGVPAHSVRLRAAYRCGKESSIQPLDARRGGSANRRRLGVEQLDSRDMPSTSQLLPGGILSITGTAGRDQIRVTVDTASSQVIVLDSGVPSAHFNSTLVSRIALRGGSGDDYLAIDNTVTVPAVIDAGPGNDVLRAGGGPTTLLGGAGDDKLVGSSGHDEFVGGPGRDAVLRVKSTDVVSADADDRILRVSSS